MTAPRRRLALALALTSMVPGACADERVVSDRRFVTRSNAAAISQPTDAFSLDTSAPADASPPDASTPIDVSNPACEAALTAEDRARLGQPCDGNDSDRCEDGVWVCVDDALNCNDDANGISESCNRADDDCDGATDEDFTTLGDTCDGEDADECRDGVVACAPDGIGVICTDDAASVAEICNDRDDDCDGGTDEGLSCSPTTSRVCYPGTAFDNSVCFDLVAAATVTDNAYDYPASGDARYRAPDYYLDLQTATGSTRVAANFRLDEFMQSAKGRYGVFRPLTVAHWQRIRASLGVPLIVTSGYWSPGRNETIDGASTNSRHMYGDAADVTANGAVTLDAIRAACVSESADFTQIYTTHVHCDWRDEAHTNDFWLATPRAAVVPGDGVEDAGLDPWSRVWADVEVVLLDGGRARLAAVWGDGFDEGEPWVSWEVRAPGAELVEALEPVTAIEVVRGAEVRWRVGGVVEGQLIVP